MMMVCKKTAPGVEGAGVSTSIAILEMRFKLVCVWERIALKLRSDVHFCPIIYVTELTGSSGAVKKHSIKLIFIMQLDGQK